MAETLSLEISISAPIEIVWAVLTDFENYYKWNPFTPKVEVSGGVGDPVILQAAMGSTTKTRRVELTLSQMSDYSLCWGDDAWYLPVLRCQKLTPINAFSTRYHNSERFGGLLSPLVLLTQQQKLMVGYTRAAQGLKVFSETHKKDPMWQRKSF